MIDSATGGEAQLAAEAAHRRLGGDPDMLRTLVAMIGDEDALPAKWRSGAWRLVADSLVGLRLERVTGARRMADIGTGAGFPGLVLATVLPGTNVTLIESKPERSRFLRRALHTLELGNVELLTMPVEAWDAGSGVCDVVTSRNLAPANVLVELAAPLLRLHGSAVLWARRRSVMLEAEAQAAAAAVGLRREQVREEGRRCVLYVYAKVAPTPPGFPRPVGAAFTNSLGLDIDPADWEPDNGRVYLTPLERRVLRLLADGRGRAEVARKLDLPMQSAGDQIRRIRRKLAAKSIDEAVARARGCGLLPRG